MRVGTKRVRQKLQDILDSIGHFLVGLTLAHMASPLFAQYGIPSEFLAFLGLIGLVLILWGRPGPLS